jgi:hypothetical protein
LPIKQTQEEEPSVAVIPPRSRAMNSHLINIVLTDETIKLAEQEKKPLYVWGSIKYEDIFKESHETQFCVVNTLNSPHFNFCSNNNTTD